MNETRRSRTRLRGLGEQLIKIPAAELRDLAELPDEVEIVDIIRASSMQQYPSEFYPPIAVDQFPLLVSDPRDTKDVLVHIRSRYAVRRPPGAALMIEDFDSFMATWNQLWKDKR